MNSAQFVEQTHIVAKYIVDYIDNLEKRKILSDVTPGYLSAVLPQQFEEEGVKFSDILMDMDRKIMPGVVHWAHPHFHGYLPSSHAYPSILADMFSGSLGAMSFSWIAGPALVELEIAMTDWLGRSLGLPHAFLHGETTSDGGGIMASSASECALLTLLAARLKAINLIKAKKRDSGPDEEDSAFLPHLVAYCSQEAHSCIEKAAHIAMVRLRVLETNSYQQLSPSTLKHAIDEDMAGGLWPCYVVATLGTSSSGAFDSLKDIAPIVRSIPGCWLHVNAAYGGNNFICPELRGPLKGIDLADSFCVNPYKGLLMNIDSTCLWVRDRVAYCSALIVNPLYLENKQSDLYLDHRHWSIWLSRRSRSFKIWFTFRLYGVTGLQAHVRKMIRMARTFARLVRKDNRFELCNRVDTALVCFRLVGSDSLNHQLLALINGNGKVLMTPAVLETKFVVRFVVGNEGTDEDAVKFAWVEVARAADLIQSGTDWGEQPEEDFRRLSFTRRVSFLDYRRYHTKLKGAEAPVLVPAEESKKESSTK